MERYFYPRPPRGGRPGCGGELTVNVNISIHALREEGDGPPVKPRNLLTSFLSTPSARRATKSPFAALRHLVISIHALREEGDGCRNGGHELAHNFYPRPPRGGRPSAPLRPRSSGKFLSTLSARRATLTT